MNCWKNIIKSGLKSVIVLDIEPVYNEQTIKTKIKSYEGKINISFRDDRMPKEGSHCIYL